MRSFGNVRASHIYLVAIAVDFSSQLGSRLVFVCVVCVDLLDSVHSLHYYINYKYCLSSLHNIYTRGVYIARDYQSIAMYMLDYVTTVFAYSDVEPTDV